MPASSSSDGSVGRAGSFAGAGFDFSEGAGVGAGKDGSDGAERSLKSSGNVRLSSSGASASGVSEGIVDGGIEAGAFGQGCADVGAGRDGSDGAEVDGAERLLKSSGSIRLSESGATESCINEGRAGCGIVAGVDGIAGSEGGALAGADAADNSASNCLIWASISLLLSDEGCDSFKNFCHCAFVCASSSAAF